jgi:hypothetical protein
MGMIYRRMVFDGRPVDPADPMTGRCGREWEP